MKRKSFDYKDLKFFERNKEDVDFTGIGERFKANNFRFIQAETKNVDDKLALLGMEMHKEYTSKELTMFMYGDLKEIRMCLWQSYKLGEDAGEKINRDKMKEIIDGEEKIVLSLLLQLENPPKKVTDRSGEPLSEKYSDALLLATYNLKPEELGKLTQRIYSELLEQIPAVITYQQTGEVLDGDGKNKKDVENIKWAKEQGLMKK